MLRKYREWKKKPITWGDYMKLCKWSFAAIPVIWGIEAAYIYREEIKSWVDEHRKSVTEEDPLDEYEGDTRYFEG